MVHFVSRHGTLRSTPGNFRQVTEKNRLYSVFFDFAVECGQSDFEQAGCFGLITFCIFQHTGDVATLHGRSSKLREWFHQIVRNGCSVYRAASRQHPAVHSRKQSDCALSHYAIPGYYLSRVVVRGLREKRVLFP